MVGLASGDATPRRLTSRPRTPHPTTGGQAVSNVAQAVRTRLRNPYFLRDFGVEHKEWGGSSGKEEGWQAPSSSRQRLRCGRCFCIPGLAWATLEGVPTKVGSRGAG